MGLIIIVDDAYKVNNVGAIKFMEYHYCKLSHLILIFYGWRAVIDRAICGVIIASTPKTPSTRPTDKIYVFQRAFNYVL
ncbi:hypothetical protein Zmor_012792 [Zophobas morio]|uniref:Uncharacterized protein n=1 Tax=Zophobas morio TaxID=2755281 RepID=A0AA38IGP5_9CUCU|nr:hypothetical protein Zmor_012792 [Zophobas morio]